MKLSVEAAETVIATAKAAIAEKGYPPVCISVVDDGARLVAFSRMGNAIIDAIDDALRKARTAAVLHVDRAGYRNVVRLTPAARMVESIDGGLAAAGGGVVLRDGEGRVIGAVGVSGASADEDETVARAAAAALAD